MQKTYTCTRHGVVDVTSRCRLFGNDPCAMYTHSTSVHGYFTFHCLKAMNSMTTVCATVHGYCKRLLYMLLNRGHVQYEYCTVMAHVAKHVTVREKSTV